MCAAQRGKKLSVSLERAANMGKRKVVDSDDEVALEPEEFEVSR